MIISPFLTHNIFQIFFFLSRRCWLDKQSSSRLCLVGTTCDVAQIKLGNFNFVLNIIKNRICFFFLILTLSRAHCFVVSYSSSSSLFRNKFLFEYNLWTHVTIPSKSHSSISAVNFFFFHPPLLTSSWSHAHRVSYVEFHSLNYLSLFHRDSIIFMTSSVAETLFFMAMESCGDVDNWARMYFELFTRLNFGVLIYSASSIWRRIMTEEENIGDLLGIF